MAVRPHRQSATGGEDAIQAASFTGVPVMRRACRITRVTGYVVGMRRRNCVSAHVETDDGISGIDEGSLEYQPQAVAAAIDQLAHRDVLGESALSIEKLFSDMLRNEFMRGPIISSAIAAIEMAMWDIVGKALDRPIYDLLGGRMHSRLPVCADAWYGQASTTAEMEKAAAAVADAAYIPVSFHNPFGPVATAAAVQPDACTSNFIMQESFCEYDVPMRFDLLDHAPRPQDGHYEISERPGLGVGEFWPEVALAHPFDRDAFLPLFRPGWSSRY
jgi:L-alanine-DL-glutamate epimerase-like enolase superfamily enzyme